MNRGNLVFLDTFDRGEDNSHVEPEPLIQKHDSHVAPFICLETRQQRHHFPHSRDFVFSPVSRHFQQKPHHQGPGGTE